MKKLLLIIPFSFLVLASNSQPERRFQIWNKNEIIIQPWHKIFIDVAEKMQYSHEHNALEIIYGEIFLSHQPVKWFEYGAGFRVLYGNTYPDWLQENRTMLIANFTKDYKHFSFKYSNRFEYRSFENGLHHFRYRQEFKIDFPSLTSWGMRFYTSEESFSKLNGIGLHLARFYEGLSVLQKEHFKLKTYYALEKYKLIENWGTSDIVGVNMTFVL